MILLLFLEVEIGFNFNFHSPEAVGLRQRCWYHIVEIMLMNVHCTVLKNSVLHDLRKNLISKNQLLFSTWKSSWRGFLMELKLKEYYIRNLYLEHGKQFRCPIVVLLNPSSKSRRGLLVPRVDILRPSALEVKHPRVLRQLHVRLNLKFWTILDPWSNNLCIFFSFSFPRIFQRLKNTFPGIQLIFHPRRELDRVVNG